jgi:hypothetical protein
MTGEAGGVSTACARAIAAKKSSPTSAQTTGNAALSASINPSTTLLR